MKRATTLISFIILATITVGNAAANQTLYNKQIDFEKAALDSVIENNCGELHFKALELKTSDLVDSNNQFKGIMQTIPDDAKKSDCRAIVSGEQIWVRITSINEEENKDCQVYIPFNAINLFNNDDNKYPHLAEDMLINNLGSFSKCVDIKEESVKLNEAEEDVLAINYLNNLAELHDIMNNKKLNSDDKNALIKEITENNEIKSAVEEIDGLSDEGKEELKEMAHEHIPAEKLNNIVENSRFKLEVNKVEKKYPKITVSNLDDSDNEQNHEKLQNINEKENYLSPSQIDDNASYCNETQIKRVVSLYKALATAGKLKTIQIWEQNIVECIIGHENHHLKAVLKFNDAPCLFDIKLDRENEAKLIESPGIGLEACHKKPLFK